MKKSIAILIILLISTLSRAYIWEGFGPAGIDVNNVYISETNPFAEIICASNGLYLFDGENWNLYSSGTLPVWSAFALDENHLLVILGNGSYSDGIYSFNLNTFEFTVLAWLLYPHFLEFCQTDNNFYVGHEYGLFKSANGWDWEEVDYFSNQNCLSMAYSNNNYVISTDVNTHYSNDNGISWNESNSYKTFSDMIFFSPAILYGIFPGESWSSGFYHSYDYAENWEVEFWATMMSSVGIDFDNNIFLGWEEPTAQHQGVAIYTPDNWNLTFVNDGLPNLNINKITYHPAIDCLNMICCTDSGAFMITNYEDITALEETQISKQNFNISISPNPFHSETTISFNVTQTSRFVTLEIYNIRGQKVKSFYVIPSGVEGSIVWDGNDDSGKKLYAGIYLVNVKTVHGSLTRKLILMR